MPKQHVLIIDDEVAMLKGLQRFLSEELPEVAVAICHQSEQAVRMVIEQHFDLILLDIRMPGVDGLELLPRIKRIDPQVTVIMMTAFGSIDVAVQSFKQGASEFISKPFAMEDLLRMLRSNLKRSQLLKGMEHQPGQENPLVGLADFVGRSKPMQDLLASIRSVASTDCPVLIRGKSGTGKELVARAIHKLSKRSSRELVAVNCPAIPEHLLESELFGYKKGAFTGAEQDKEGLFQEAHGSSLLLDEVGDIPVSLQTKLLRVLQEQEVRPLGSGRTDKVDVRILSTTNQDLEQKIAAKTFREDLFFRLHVVTIHTPSLEEMSEDIPLLVDFFTQHASQELGMQPKPLTPAAIDWLKQRAWPGNVRELQNLIRRAMILSHTEEITLEQLVDMDCRGRESVEEACSRLQQLELEPYNQAKERVLQDFTVGYAHQLMRRTQGNISQAAALAGISRVALQKILRRTGLDPQRYRMEEKQGDTDQTEPQLPDYP